MKLDFYSIANTRVEYYEGMVEADIEIDKNHTAYIICEEKVVDKVKAMFQSKELSDDVIDEYAFAFELWLLNNPDKTLEGIKDFARAILKKASEK